MPPVHIDNTTSKCALLEKNNQFDNFCEVAIRAGAFMNTICPRTTRPLPVSRMIYKNHDSSESRSILSLNLQLHHYRRYPKAML